MNTKSCIFLPRVKIPLLVFMSEIKINLTPEKIKFSVSFMLKCGKKINVFQFVSRHHRKLTFFPSHYASILWCSTYLLGIILGVNSKFAPRKQLEISICKWLA